MRSFLDIFRNHVVICGVIAWFVAQGLKIPIHYITNKKWDLQRFFGSGGMPSSHTSIVISSCVMIGSIYGYHTGLFAVMFILSIIVMYDATGVRRETGRQGTVINEILRRIFEGEQITDKDLKELVGHTPLEVFAGAILGIIIALIYQSLMR